MKAAGGSYTASGGHSGHFDYNGAALTGKRTLSRRPTVETSGTGKKRRVTVKSQTVPKGQLNQSNVREEEPAYDKHLLANMGAQRLTSLSMKAGSRLGPIDRFGPFLKNLQQNGKITMSWNGSIQTSVIDDRHVSMQMFRHSLSENQYNTGNGPYPQNTANKPMILYPASQTGLNLNYIANLSNKPSVGDTIKNPFYKHLLGEVSFVPLNLPDMEDMSWNLNKLKLGRSSLTTTPAGLSVTANVPNYEINKHRRQSTLRQNNFTAVSTAVLSPTATVSADTKASTYLYDACIRYGTIQYEFMNKQDTGATVEVILYKVKKTQQLDADHAKYQNNVTINQNTGTALTCNYPLSHLVDAVSKGYVDTVGQDYATENFQGRQPNYIDVYNNPNYPLLPNKLKKTVEGDLPLSEVMRNKFVMSAGSRRAVTLHLPGMLYNPASKPAIPVGQTTINDNQLPYNSVPVCDGDTYAVVLACNGQKMTRFFDNQARSAVPDDIVQTFRPNWYVLPEQQGSGLDPTSAPAPLDQVPYMWFGPHDPANPLSHTSGTTVTYTVTYLVSTNVWEDTAATVDVKFLDYTGSATEPNPLFPRYCVFSNFVSNGAMLSYNVQYNLRNLPSFVQQNWVTGDAPFLCSFALRDYGSVTVVGKAAVLPEELAMGDNHGLSHVDYCATYTEHIGACVYKEKKERNLFDCGQPLAPVLDAGAATGSIEASRMILPAVNVVRQAKRVGYDIDSTGVATNLNVELPTDNN